MKEEEIKADYRKEEDETNDREKAIGKKMKKS